MTRVLVLAACLLVAICPTACVSGIERAPPERLHYVLDVTRPDPLPPASEGPVLEVKAFQSDPAWAGSAFLHRHAGGRVETDYYHGLLVPPAIALAEITRRWLAGSGKFRAVLAPGSRLTPDWMLEGEVEELAFDASGEGPAAAVSLRFLVIDAGSGGLVAQHSYRSTVPAGGAEPEALVAAMGRAVAEILTQLESDLAAR
jgi:hypothetical protein